MNDLYKKYLACACRVTSDSRAINGGEIFFALKGENFDGNAYAIQALEKGAEWAVVDKAADLPDDPRLIKVEDSFKTLQELAVWHRNHVLGDAHLPVIGLTGTNGKTTTKELIAAVLSRKYRVTATQGNLNNDIGVPLSLLKITPDTQIAVIEMGANHPDDIEKLVRVCQPDYGLITNVGKAHLLGFGSFEGVKQAKGALYRWLGTHRGSLIFLNQDDENLKQMAAGQACHIFGYGLKYQKAVILPSTPEEPFVRIELDGRCIKSQLVGAYNATNILAAMAVGEYFGVKREDAAAAIEGYCPTNNRSQMSRTSRNTLIVDAYNANPSSMEAALDNFSLIEAENKIALLGDMRELGNDSVQEHIKILKHLKEKSIKAYLVGDEFRKALEACPEYKALGWFKDSDSLASELTDKPISDTVIIIKGSRGIQMEKTIQAL